MPRKLSPSVIWLLDAVFHEIEILNVGYRRHSILAFQGREGLIRVLEHEKRMAELEKLRRLKRRKFLKIRKEGNRLICTLTEKGRISLLKHKIENAKPLAPGVHLYVIFDIPEHASKARQTLRRFLKSSGFELFQKSVWRTEKNVADQLLEWVKTREYNEWICILKGKTL